MTITPWSELSLALPSYHAAISAGGSAETFGTRVIDLKPLDNQALGQMTDGEARGVALDVLMIEAFVRRHAAQVPADAKAVVESAATAAAARLGIPPILSYPLYIRDNPPEIEQIRRFTPLDAEFRFIRMHRLIEDTFDGLIARLAEVIGTPPSEQRAALAAAMPAVREGFRLVNHTMAGFRSPVRMPREDFVDGFRPYFDPLLDPVTGELLLDGPSGLQSPTYRIIAMQIGYRDAIMDGWTDKIARCHDPATRVWLAEVMAARDRGASLRAVCDTILGAAPGLPHLHPDYGAHIPLLLDLALRHGYVARDILATFDRFALALGEWPAEARVPGDPPGAYRRAEGGSQAVPDSLTDADQADLAHLVEIEAMLFGFHLEHVATAAVQIGAVRGTGGTSGVEFLLIATFRRAFPWLWASGVAELLAGGGVWPEAGAVPSP